MNVAPSSGGLRPRATLGRDPTGMPGAQGAPPVDRAAALAPGRPTDPGQLRLLVLGAVLVLSLGGLPWSTSSPRLA